MVTDKPAKSNHRYVVAIGIGLALFPVHNKWLVDATKINGEATLFLPAFGAVMWMLATLFYLRDNWQGVEWGDKKIYIPLLIVVGAIGLSGIKVDDWGGKFAPLFMGFALFSLYVVARKLGKDIFLPLAIGAGIASVGVIIAGTLNLGERTGGIVFEGNYDIVVGYVLLGVALFIKKDQWILASLALVAMFLSGSPEAVFALGVMSVVVLLRNDWGKKLAITIVPVVLIGTLWFGLGYGQNLYGYTISIAKGSPVLDEPVLPASINPPSIPTSATPPTVSSGRPPQITNNEDNSPKMVSTIEYRVLLVKNAMVALEPLGTGYNITAFNNQFVHNVPLVIVQQLGYPGILAGLAWLWVSGWCLVRTKWKYVWGLVLALSVFDHFIWTQLAPWWWAIIGASTASSLKSDLVFKKGSPVLARLEYMSQKLMEE